MITDFFNSPFKNYEDNRVQLKEIQDQSPPNKNRSFQFKNSQLKKLRYGKLQKLPNQVQSVIQTIIPENYQQELHSLHNSQFLRVKNTNDTFFGETIFLESSGSFFKHKAKVANGLCEIFFENNSYLIGCFENGILQGELIFVLENGSYIKAKPKVKKPKRSVSGFITDDSQSLASDDNSSDEQKISESDIRVQICDLKPFNFFSNLQCEMNFNGIYYKCSIKKGQLNGYVLEKGNNYQFQGNFVMGQRRRGKMISDYGFEYQGTFKYNKFDGLGTLKTKDGVYSGQFRNGLKDGQGQFKWNDGSYYKGDFKNDQREGKGFFKSKQGSFKGQWRNDQIQGSGYLVIGNHGVGGQWSKNNYSRPNKFF